MEHMGSIVTIIHSSFNFIIEEKYYEV